MTTRKLMALAVCVALAASLGIWSRSGPRNPEPSPRAGILDLGSWNFARDGSVSLAGQWLYFDRSWERRSHLGAAKAVGARVPGPWPAREANSDETRRQGFGTYTLEIHLPSATAGDTFVVNSGQILAAYRLFANGRLIAAPGIPSETAQGERDNSYSVLADLPPGTRNVELSLELSNHMTRYGGIFVAPSIGLKSALEAARRLSEALSLIVIGALFFTACFHIAFLRVTRAGYANLWFGALAGLFCIRMLFTEPLASSAVPLIGQDLVWRLDIATTELLLPAAFWFLALSFPRHIARKFGYILGATCAVVALASLIAGPIVGELTLKFIEALGLVTIPYLAMAILRSAGDNEHGARLALAGWIICSFAAFHDILIDNQIVAGSNFLPLGCVAFFLFLSGALTQRSHHAFVRVELLVDERTRQLHEKIAELEQARAAAVSANIAKSRFLANMSHELRTPLNAILGFSEIIRDRIFGEEITGRYSDYAASIHTSGSHLLGLITDVLDLAKIEAGKLQLVDTALDLGEEARAALRLLEPQAHKRQVRLAFDLAEPCWVLADARAVRQILINLLSNAVKFTPSGGVVSLAIAQTTDKSVVIAVKDSGIGIGPEDMERVFENFGQGRPDIRATNETGTGLGLPICKGLVEALGGWIEMASTVNVGTTVTVCLPARRSIEPADASNAA